MQYRVKRWERTHAARVRLYSAAAKCHGSVLSKMWVLVSLVRFDYFGSVPLSICKPVLFNCPSKTRYRSVSRKDCIVLCFDCIREQLVTDLNVNVFSNLRHCRTDRNHDRTALYVHGFGSSSVLFPSLMY